MQLHRARSEFEAAGVPLVLIGQATPRHAAHFRRVQEIELPVLADEERESYGAAGAKVASATEMLGPKSIAKGFMKTAQSRGKIRQGKVIGHPAQLGGAMVIAPDGTVAWSYMSKDPSDSAPVGEILAAAREATIA